MDLVTRQLSFRLPQTLIDRVEECVESIQQKSGMNVTRADVVRLLLTRALDAAGCDLQQLFTAPPKPRRRRSR